VWERLATAYEKVDPLAVLPVLARLVDNELTEAGAQHYRIAARRLAKMRKLASGSGEAAGVDGLIAELRETHRRRPRLQQEFDRIGLPSNDSPENASSCKRPASRSVIGRRGTGQVRADWAGKLVRF
jgi:hypothetical protein